MTLSSEAKTFFASALASEANSLIDSVNGIVREIADFKNSWPGQKVSVDGDARSNLSAAESAMLSDAPSGRVTALLSAAIGNELGSLRDRLSSSRPITEFDIPAEEGFLRKVGKGSYTLHKSNLSALTDPLATDDAAKGYGVGSEWGNATDSGFFVCAKATQGQAVWIEVASVATVASHVVGPGSATNNAVCRFDLATGKLIQNSAVIIDDSDNMSGIGNITLSGTVDGRDLQTDGSKLDLIEALADVTDATNVKAAGAAMLADAETIANDWTFATDKKLFFRDSGQFLHSNEANDLTLAAAAQITITAPTTLLMGDSSTNVKIGNSATTVNIANTSVANCNVGVGATASAFGMKGGDIDLGDNTGSVYALKGQKNEWTLGESGAEFKEVWSTAFYLTTRQTYTVTDHSTDRALDADSDTLEQVADVLGTLITDLKTAGILQ